MAKSYESLRESYMRYKRLATSAKKKGEMRKAVELERAALKMLQQMKEMRE